MKPRDQPLRTIIRGGRLVISIGIDTLAFSDEERRKHESKHAYRIVDADQFAKDVAEAIGHDNEDGSSLLSNLFDLACEQALDDGSEGVEYLEENVELTEEEHEALEEAMDSGFKGGNA